MVFKKLNFISILFLKLSAFLFFIEEILRVNFIYKFLIRKKRILQCTTFSLKNPDHGGKLRSFFIRKSLRNFYNVETLSFDWRPYEDLNSFDVKISKKLTKGDLGLFCDLLIEDYLEENSHVFKKLAKKISNFCPNIILLEQPYIWPLIKKCIKEEVISQNTKIVYSSHNIEFEMKDEIYKKYCSNKDIRLKYLNRIKAMEEEVISNCALAFAVSDNDAEFIKVKYPNKKVKVFKNGSLTPRVNPLDLLSKAKWINNFKKHKKNWVYIASWHPPNIEGLFSLIQTISRKNKNIEANFNLWVLGDVGSGIKEKFKQNNIKIYPWLKILGHVSSRDVNQSIIYSSGVVLPIWEGGGSNLKTSQALLSGKCVIASKPSLRSFEDSEKEEGVFVAD